MVYETIVCSETLLTIAPAFIIRILNVSVSLSPQHVGFQLKPIRDFRFSIYPHWESIFLYFDADY